MKKQARYIWTILLGGILTVSMTGCGEMKDGTATAEPAVFPHEYGVFLSLDNTDLSVFQNYKIIVIDAQHFLKEDIEQLHDAGHIVYSYLNVGSVEKFRDYYTSYEDITLGDYDNWPEERWVDVSNKRWHGFIVNTLAQEMIGKGVDGFFIDNCDVYYVYQRQDIYQGLVKILKDIKSLGKAVIINGGDTFVDGYFDENGSVSDVLTGINQETVFSSIDFENEIFSTADEEEHSYFSDYVERFAAENVDIFLLEYTQDTELVKQIEAYCAEKDFKYYVSDSIELDG